MNYLLNKNNNKKINKIEKNSLYHLINIKKVNNI